MVRSIEKTAILNLERALNCSLDLEQIVYVDFEERVLSVDECDYIVAEAMSLEEFIAAVITYHRYQGSYQAYLPVFDSADDGMASW